ncbi:MULTISPECIES: oligosaccharide MFS transporter [unclassified Gilliamella]|uniref:oligosaccharide MFS transporter n=1 Tax=unclassified Gilliamella TaxID=2685620 RepID=UPI00080E6E41|nr:oligosaccharide MFS transporter [Gilliamella apicola]OCG18581.1 MFS transporter [Gilliamella apicola]OCG24408.1 MFS transporter [Gilliamella apicola]
MISAFYNKPTYWFASCYSFMYYAAGSFVFSFYAIWLSKEIGLTAKQTGIIYSFNYFVSLIIMIVYGVYQDKLVLKKQLIWFQSIIITLAAPALIYVYEPLLKHSFYIGVIFGSFFLGFGWVAGMGLIDSYCEKISRAFGFEFGQCRTWGCIAYAVGTFIAGILISLNPHLNFWAASGVGICFMLLNLNFKPDLSQSAETVFQKKDKLSFNEIISVFTLKKFWIFVIYVLGTYSLYNIYDQQLFPVYFTQQFDDINDGYRLYGILNSFQVFLEAVVMFCVPFVVNRVGAKNALIFAAFISASRIFLTGHVNSIAIISIIKLMHCLEISTILVSVFKYIDINFNARLSATVFLIGYQVAGSIGVILFSTLVGDFYDTAGAATTFNNLGLVVLGFMIFAIFFLNGDKKRRYK